MLYFNEKDNFFKSSIRSYHASPYSDENYGISIYRRPLRNLGGNDTTIQVTLLIRLNFEHQRGRGNYSRYKHYSYWKNDEFPPLNLTFAKAILP